MPVQQFLDLVEFEIFLHRDEILFRSHDAGYRSIEIVLKAHIPAGDYADQTVVIKHRHARDIVLFNQSDELAHRCGDRNGDRVFDHPAFILFDDSDFTCLFLDRHAFMNDAESPFLRHGDRQTGFRNGIHSRRYQRDIQTDGSGDSGFEIDCSRQNS